MSQVNSGQTDTLKRFSQSVPSSILRFWKGKSSCERTSLAVILIFLMMLVTISTFLGVCKFYISCLWVLFCLSLKVWERKFPGTQSVTEVRDDMFFDCSLNTSHEHAHNVY